MASGEGWLRVGEALRLPLPDTSWMSFELWLRERFTGWMGWVHWGSLRLVGDFLGESRAAPRNRVSDGFSAL